MSLEICVTCGKEATPWKYVVGHLCQDCSFQDKWINVNDQLPEDYKEVLYLAINEIGSKELMIGHRQHGKWTHCCLFYSTQTLLDIVKVTHWMYLPEYPNES